VTDDRIVCAVDASPVAREVVSVAVSLADSLDLDLVLSAYRFAAERRSY
jgi:hypothetical protein